MKVSFFENEFEEHNKGGENYQESPESERGGACRLALSRRVFHTAVLALTCLVAGPKKHAKGQDFHA
jgi:hypothetical protein